MFGKLNIFELVERELEEAYNNSVGHSRAASVGLVSYLLSW